VPVVYGQTEKLLASSEPHHDDQQEVWKNSSAYCKEKCFGHTIIYQLTKFVLFRSDLFVASS
jgi:hypothetical protein